MLMWTARFQTFTAVVAATGSIFNAAVVGNTSAATWAFCAAMAATSGAIVSRKLASTLHCLPNVKEHPASTGDTQSNQTDGGGLDVSSCSASSILEEYGASSLQELYDAYKKGEGWIKWRLSQTRIPEDDPSSGYVLLRTDRIVES